MSARRQPSTTSLSKYARTNASAVTNRSFDFCNAFWGISDGGVEVLFARMRGASRTMEELRNFWKERAAIEEEYAKRLTKLAKVTLGRDEIGELRNSLDTIRLETDKQAGYHQQLAHQIRTDLQGQAASFNAKQAHHKKAYQAAIEKEYRAKQTQESYVNTAREKYESDCIRINSYTAQSSLMQGKELDKIQVKLERAQQTVQANEKDFANFAKNLQETVQKWEQNWRSFCDTCQDLEEERLEFMKDNMWAYANAVSTVCVNDDESCEKMRLALEQMEPEKDMENFVRDYGTGNLIPDPPAFVNYTNGEAPPSNSSRPTTRPAQFNRQTQRVIAPRAPPVEDEPLVNTAGIGAGGSRRDGSLQRTATQNQGTARDQGQSVVKESGATSLGGPNSRRPAKPSQDPTAEPIDPTAETFIKVGPNAYKVDLSNDPQQGSSRPSGSSSTQQAPKGVDPLAEQMENLKNAVFGSGSVRRRSGNWKPSDQRAGQSSSRKGTMDSTAGPSSLTLPSSSANAATPQGQSTRDYRNSAEFVVGTHPSVSRPSSPNPPSAAFMRPPQGGAPPSSVDVETVVADYQGSLPGERKAVSRPNSRQGSYSDAPPSQGTQSRHGHQPSHGHTGVGAHGRSSPHPISRSASPAAGNRNNLGSQPPRGNGPGAGFGQSLRNASPNRVGIVLDPNGAVVEDSMADRFNQSSAQPPPHPYNNQTQERRTSYIGANNNAMVPPSRAGYTPPPPAGYPPAPVNPSYASRPVYNQPPAPYGPPPQPVYQPQSHPGYAPAAPAPASNNARSYPGYAGGYRPPSPAVERTPSPLPPPGAPPTGQTTEEGVGILFYVKALYDYNATIEEEFDFQAGDIIAVTATPEDGWWSGELLDEARRQPGRHVFPSNFVCLF